MSLEQLEDILEGCKQGNRLSQKRLYQQFYGYGMSISARYTSNREDAKEICQDSFIKVFSKIEACANVGAFKGWLRRIFVNTAIDHFRKNHTLRDLTDSIEAANHVEVNAADALDAISIEEKLRMVDKLPPAYKIAFNLYAVEGFTTAEIAESLQITEGTVRSNLAKARIKLQNLILESEKIKSKYE